MLLNCARVGLQPTQTFLLQAPFWGGIKLKCYKDNTTAQLWSPEHNGALRRDWGSW